MRDGHGQPPRRSTDWAERILGEAGPEAEAAFPLYFFLPILLGAALRVVAGWGSEAVHDENFQLEGNIAATPTTNVGGHPQNFDWESFFNSAGQSIYTSFPDPAVPGFTASGFDRDFTLNNGTYDTGDITTYTQGSKDIDNVSLLGVYPGEELTNKRDILRRLYRGLHRPRHGDTSSSTSHRNGTPTTATRNVGFWFLQDPSANCGGRHRHHQLHR